ncbi:MAG: AmmeMemoRadiSam system protein B [Candidatus Micrarchaeota archaeon]
MTGTREPAVAGAFYPAEALELKRMVDGFLRAARPKRVSDPRIVIAPHAGYIYSGPTAGFAFKPLEGLQIKRVFLLGPSHYAAFPGLGEDNHDKWKTPLGTVKVRRLSDFAKSGSIFSIPQAFAPEHCLEVEIPFLQAVLHRAFEIVPALTGDISPSDAADIIAPLLDSDSLLLVSSDLSHYHSYEQANRIDGITCKAISALDMEAMQSHGEACGKTGVLAAMLIAKKLGLKCSMLDYRNSGDTAGDRLRVVGYGSFAFGKA